MLLIGMMGAGKTTVGRLVAGRLGWRYVDSDAQVEARTGKTVREIFETEGEAAFREEEATALKDAVESEPRAVIAVAGGAVLREDNRQSIRSAGAVVWLRASPRVLAGRVAHGEHRPLLAENPAETLERLAEERRPFYEGLAELTIDVDAAAPDEAAERIVEWLEAFEGER